jgi:RNA polymerase sigma-70 factor (ECF subfamily)
VQAKGAVDDQSQWLMARWQQGDEDAAKELFHRYSERLVALVRSRLADKLAPRVDPEDVVQSVYRSFFSNARDSRYVLEQSGDLWRLLVSMTMHKVFGQARRHRAEKRSVDREQPLIAGDGWFGLSSEMLSREPSPDDAAAVVDELEHVMGSLDPLHRRMVEMRLQGYGTPEIAAEVDRSNRMVNLVLEQVREELKKRLQEYEGKEE